MRNNQLHYPIFLKQALQRLSFFFLILLHSVASIASSFHPDSLVLAEPTLVSMFANMDKGTDLVPQGLLYDCGITPVDYRLFNGEPSQNNIADFSTFFYILQGLNSSVVNSSASIVNLDSMLSGMSSIIENYNHVPVGMAVYKFSHISADAISSGMLDFQESTGTLENVYLPNGTMVNPYEESNLVAFSPYVSIVPSSVVYNFSNTFRYTNQSISHITFNAGDGTGNNVVTSNALIPITYTTAGRKTLSLTVALTSGEVLYARSYVDVILPPSTTFTPPLSDAYNVQTFTSEVESDGVYPQATISIYYASGNSLSTPPIIVAEGFDPFSDPLGLFLSEEEKSQNPPIGWGANNLFTFKNEIDSLSIVLNRDIIYIDWLNSTCSIESNASILKQIICWVNDRKPSNTKSILFGRSMGGLIGRVALRQMELSGTPHEISTFVCNDTPHLGANVPLGAVFFAQFLFAQTDDPLLTINESIIQLLSSVFPNIQSYQHELMRLRSGTGVKQMLQYYVNSNLDFDNSAFLSFQETLNNMGFPKGDSGSSIINLCLSNGGQNTYTSLSPLLRVSCMASTGGRVRDWATVIYTLLTKDVSRLPSIGSVSSIFVNLEINPYLTSNTKVFAYQKGYRKDYAWDSSVTVYSQLLEYNAPANLIPIDSSDGSYYEIPNVSDASLAISASNALVNADFTFDIQSKFLFVPTVSSLCYKNGQNLTAADYRTHFELTGVDLDEIPFDGYRFYNSSRPSYHTWIGIDDLSFVMQFADTAICDSLTTGNQKQYYLNKGSLPVLWSSTDPTVATIDANTGIVAPVGYGTTIIYANVNTSLGHVRLKKTLEIPPPTSINFPTYSLTSQDYSFGDESDTYKLHAIEYGAFSQDLLPYVNYCWGRRVGTSTTITWEEHQNRIKMIDLPINDDHVFYFKVKCFDLSSPVYFIACLSLPRLVPVDPLGNLYTEDMGEVIGNVKGVTDEAGFIVSCLGQEFFFDSTPTLAELCGRMLTNESFRTEVKRLRPWGEEETIIIPYVCWQDGNDNNVEHSVIVFQYSPDIQPK